MIPREKTTDENTTVMKENLLPSLFTYQSVCPRVWERSGIDVLAGSTSTA
jgi:hypothetical protein